MQLAVLYSVHIVKSIYILYGGKSNLVHNIQGFTAKYVPGGNILKVINTSFPRTVKLSFIKLYGPGQLINRMALIKHTT